MAKINSLNRENNKKEWAMDNQEERTQKTKIQANKIDFSPLRP